MTSLRPMLARLVPALACFGLLTACGGEAPPLTVREVVDRPAPADLVQPCEQHPQPPAEAELRRNDQALRAYLVELAFAGQDCRDKHRRLADWALTPRKASPARSGGRWARSRRRAPWRASGFFHGPAGLGRGRRW